MRSLIVVILVSVICVRGAKAEEGTDSLYKINSVEDSLDIARFETKLDDALVDWYTNKFKFSYPDSIEMDSLPHAAVNVHDSIYQQRLNLMSQSSAIEMPFNDKVKAHINLYVNRKRELSSAILGLEPYYFPLFEEILDREGLPMELKYMPVIESALKPRAFSRAGASGLWQFMYYTGKQYGLSVNSFVDERRDPRKATESAVKFLKDLYTIYGDWYLVIAAYNCGPGNVNKAIRRSGGKKDYWAIYYRLPRETRGYVPAFIAANYMMNYSKEHNLYPTEPDYPMMIDTLKVSDNVHLAQVSEVLKIPLNMLQTLNPQYRKDIIPGGSKEYDLRLPVEFVGDYIGFEDSIRNHKADKYLLAKRETVSPNSSSSYIPSTPTGKTKLYYTVKSGDNLGFISEWYNVRTSDLRYWNNIYRNLIRVGQKLSVYVPNEKADAYRELNKMSFSEKQKFDGKSITPKYTASANTSYDSNYEYYKVRSGDNLWTIARRYPGISSDDIKRLNNLDSGSRIAIGQLLKIKRKG